MCFCSQTEIELSVAVASTAISIGAVFYKVKAIVIHEMYQYVTNVIAVNDIALLLLEDPIRIHRGVGIAKLASRMVQPNLNTILIGWGKTSVSLIFFFIFNALTVSIRSKMPERRPIH